MYNKFKELALEDMDNGRYYGTECLFRFYGYGLELSMNEDHYMHFQHLVIRDLSLGRLYGFEKFFAFLNFNKWTDKLVVLPEIKAKISQYESFDKFRDYIATQSGVKRHNQSAVTEAKEGIANPTDKTFPVLSKPE